MGSKDFRKSVREKFFLAWLLEVGSKDFRRSVREKFFLVWLLEVSNLILIGFIFAYFNY